MLSFFFIIQKGECIIETGFNFFNTEAHPIDGATIDCCPSLKRESNLFTDADLNKLLNRHILLNTENQFGHVNIDDTYKTMNQEYIEAKEKELKQNERDNQYLVNLCAKLRSPSSANQKSFILSNFVGVGYFVSGGVIFDLLYYIYIV